MSKFRLVRKDEVVSGIGGRYYVQEKCLWWWKNFSFPELNFDRIYFTNMCFATENTATKIFCHVTHSPIYHKGFLLTPIIHSSELDCWYAIAMDDLAIGLWKNGYRWHAIKAFFGIGYNVLIGGDLEGIKRKIDTLLTREHQARYGCNFEVIMEAHS